MTKEMKKFMTFLRTITPMVLSLLAILTAGSVAMAGTIAVPDSMSPGSDPSADPNAGTPLEGAVKTSPEDKGGIQLPGAASGSALQQANLINNLMFKKIIEYHAQRYPFYTDLFTKATQFAFKGHKEAEYPEIGDIRTEARLKTAVSNASAKDHEVELVLPKADADIFRKRYTIIVPSMPGYDEGKDATSQSGGNGEQLELYVTASSDETSTGNIKVMAVNGPTDSTTGETYVPDIPSGALLMLGCPILAEEEVEVDPLNIIPTTQKAYLQKKGYAIAFTDFFSEAVKEVDWEKDRVKRQTLDAYKKIYTTTTLFGAKRKFVKRTKNGLRYAYSQEGFIKQLRMFYQLANGKWTKADAIAIAKMLFTAYTDATEIDVYMGSDAIESLLNIDWGTGTTAVVYEKEENLSVKVASFDTPYGKLKFKHEVSLTEHHLEKAAIAVPMEDCLRVYRDNGTTFTVDGKKGETGEVEELTKEFFVQDDCFIANTMASMLIGPSSLLTSGYGNGIEEAYQSVTEFPSSPTTGQLVYLTTPTSTNDRGLYKYNGTSWESYNRGISA